MPWPFRWRRTEKASTQVKEPVFDTDGTPVIIPVYNTDLENIIVALLERAVEASKEVPPGEVFSVMLTDEEWTAAMHPSLLIAPIFARAADYGLVPESAYNEEFSFYKE